MSRDVDGNGANRAGPHSTTITGSMDTAGAMKLSPLYAPTHPLENVVTLYEGRAIRLPEACKRIEEAINGKSGLAIGQRNKLRDEYLIALEEAGVRREHVKDRGRGGDGDQTKYQGGAHLSQGFRRVRDDEDDVGRSGLIKRARNDRDGHNPYYAWNWNRPNGEEGQEPQELRSKLSESKKTHFLRTVYSCDAEGALWSLFARGGCPPFPHNLWKDILANRFVDLGAVVEDYEGPSGKGGRILTQSQWLHGFEDYQRAVLWAFPHRRAEFSVYFTHILNMFQICDEEGRVIRYDCAVRKYVHERDHLTLADTHIYTVLTLSHFYGTGTASTAYSARKNTSGRQRSRRTRKAKNKTSVGGQGDHNS